MITRFACLRCTLACPHASPTRCDSCNHPRGDPRTHLASSYPATPRTIFPDPSSLTRSLYLPTQHTHKLSHTPQTDHAPALAHRIAHARYDFSVPVPASRFPLIRSAHSPPEPPCYACIPLLRFAAFTLAHVGLLAWNGLCSLSFSLPLLYLRLFCCPCVVSSTTTLSPYPAPPTFTFTLPPLLFPLMARFLPSGICHPAPSPSPPFPPPLLLLLSPLGACPAPIQHPAMDLAFIFPDPRSLSPSRAFPVFSPRSPSTAPRSCT